MDLRVANWRFSAVWCHFWPETKQFGLILVFQRTKIKFQVNCGQDFGVSNWRVIILGFPSGGDCVEEYGNKAHYLLRVVSLVAWKSLWPRTTVATKTKKTLLSRVVVAFVAFLCPLFLYQNAAVLYLNVDVAIFCTKEILGPTKKSWWFSVVKRKISTPQERVFFGTLTNFLSHQNPYGFSGISTCK